MPQAQREAMLPLAAGARLAVELGVRQGLDRYLDRYIGIEDDMLGMVGDHVRWNFEAGQVSDRIVKVHTRDAEDKGNSRHCADNDPKYEIRSGKTEHIASTRARRG